MEIEKLKISNLRNEEHYNFNLDFSGLVAQHTAAALGVETKLPAYLAALGKEHQALNTVQASATTEEITDADAQRDDTTRGLVGSIKLALNHFDAEVRKSAKKLKLLLDTYGEIATKPYDQETASITKLVSDLEGAYASDVAALGIAGWVLGLKNQNIAFDNLKKQRYDESTIKPQQNLKDARIETDTCYRAIIKRIEALIEINGETAYAPFVLALNQRIDNYQKVLAQRQGRNAKNEEETDGQQPEGA